MTARRTVAALLIAAGLILCGFSVRHYVRGWRAQEQGRRVLDARLPSHRGTGENPGVRLQPAASSDNPEAGVGIPPGYPYGEPLARIRIPIAQIDAIVFAGADPAVLEKGPGHVPGTELPGEHTPRHNCVITGHRDSHFRHLGWLRPGHEVEVDAPAGKSFYRVVSREIVTPDAVRVLSATPTDRLTLITCYPFNFIGPAPKRLVVVAEPAAPERSADAAPSARASILK